MDDNLHKIKITNCEIIYGEYAYDKALMGFMLISSSLDTNPKHKFLKINFESNNKDSDWFVVTSSDTSSYPDYKHTILKTQREFLFELTEYIPLDKLRINGLKNSKHGNKFIERSELIIDVLNRENEHNHNHNQYKNENLEENNKIEIII